MLKCILNFTDFNKNKASLQIQLRLVGVILSNPTPLPKCQNI